MDLTEMQCELLCNAWALASKGRGMVLQPEAYPAAHDLAEHGWLDHRFEENGDMSWWWTPQAETALDVNALTSGMSMN